MGNVYQILADTVLTIHLLVVAFVLFGLVLVLAGNGLGWRWVNNLWFRLAHLGAIAIVVAEAWLGIAYTVFGLVVVATWWWFPPRSRR